MASLRALTSYQEASSSIEESAHSSKPQVQGLRGEGSSPWDRGKRGERRGGGEGRRARQTSDTQRHGIELCYAEELVLSCHAVMV